LFHIKLYSYQLCRVLAYIHSLEICHRDIKPQNLLIKVDNNHLKLCDFGSAKIMSESKPNISYICSRYYRAPELIFSSTNYNCSIDVWAMGCVIAELFNQEPLFVGEDALAVLVEIIKVLGTPTEEDIMEMNDDYNQTRNFPSINSPPWHRVFNNDTPESAQNLISLMIQYKPNSRIKPMEALAHSFFDDLRGNEQFYKSGTCPPLFDFSPEERAHAHRLKLLDRLSPLFEINGYQ